jgi:uncharacterized repeat protein (TIGR01451 family)
VWLLFLGSFLFFFIVAGFAVFMWTSEQNAVSVRNIDVAIEGPLTVSGGEEVTLSLSLRNRNPVALKDSVLIVEFSEGTRSPDDLATPLRVARFPLGDIAAGATRSLRLPVLFFGSQGERKEVRARLEYAIEGSRATYRQEASFATTLTSSPVVVRMQAETEVVSGQESEFLIEVVNNSEQTIKNLLVDVRLPPSMEFVRATPKPDTGANLWRIPALSPKAIYPIRLTVVPVGTEGEVRTFTVRVGEEHPRKPGELAATFGALSWDVRVKNPFVALALFVNGQPLQDAVVPAGQEVRVAIRYQNTLPVALYDLRLKLRLEGNVFSPFEVKPDQAGFYDSVANVVRWDPRDVASLRQVAPGESGEVRVMLQTLSPTSIKVRPPVLQLAVEAEARRVLERDVPEQLEAVVKGEVRLATTPTLLQVVRYSPGPFENTGSIPPRVNQRTTYTIVWRVTNPLNDLTNVRVVAQLSSYVEWTGQTAPADAQIRYNATTGEVQWQEQRVPAGAGVGRPPKEVAFQVAIQPSAAQAGSKPVLVKEAVLTAKDAFTQVPIELRAPAVTTELRLDPAYNANDGARYGEVVP